MERGASSLEHWKEEMAKRCPKVQHDMLCGTELNVGKLGFGEAVATDTCNAALKTSRLMADETEKEAQELAQQERHKDKMTATL